MKSITCNVTDSLHERLIQRASADSTTVDRVISEALSGYLNAQVHELFQVSTSAALVEGLSQGAVRVSRLLRHGNFGLGTFADLDGEMIIVDGVCYRARAHSGVEAVHDDPLVPYAVVTEFSAESVRATGPISKFNELASVCDTFRSSQNIFYAFRGEGRFSTVKVRMVQAASPGVGIRAAASGQEVQFLKDVVGTLVGIWSPFFASSFSIPGYHFHFISADRRSGGHVLECESNDLTIEGCAVNEMHVMLPQTAEYLSADLSHDSLNDLLIAERSEVK